MNLFKLFTASFDPAQLLSLQNLTQQSENRIMSAISKLQTSVTLNAAAAADAIAAMVDIKTQLAAAIAANDPVALAALGVTLDKTTSDLVAALAALKTP